MNTIFAYRMDNNTNKGLELLASRTMRTRSQVIRLLINIAVANPQILLLTPEAESGCTNTPSVNTLSDGGSR